MTNELNGVNLYLVRHGPYNSYFGNKGQPDHQKNIQEACSLNQAGEQQSTSLGKYLKENRGSVDLILCSNTKYIRQSANILGRLLEVAIVQDLELIEFNSIECKTFYKNQNQAIALGITRIINWLNDLVRNQKYAGKTIMIVTHAAPISWIINYIDPTISVNVVNGSFTYITYNIKGGFKLGIYDCVNHL
ncbi:MAG: histidine phosphatase family protein [candidate division SR1 bacterium]|nr:histidine phosphatase family protein [candidate division SR1 bacterium]